MNYGSFETLLIDEQDMLLTITINRPSAKNSLSPQVVEDLWHFFTAANDALGDPQTADSRTWPVKGIMLTGAGDSFVAGADIRKLVTMEQEEAGEYSRRMHEVTLLIEALSVPVVACVTGYALGGGCELAMSCDFIYASAKAVFAQPEVNLGLIPGFGGTVRLQQRVGPALARELIYTGRFVDAAEAQRIGLVNRVFETPADALSGTRAVLVGIAGKSPEAVALSKATIAWTAGLETSEGLAVEADAFSSIFGSDDMREGTSAFLEKRTPNFYSR